MGRAAASQPAEEAGALDELRFHWGSAYYVALVDGMWTAWRNDGRGGKLTDALAPKMHRDLCRVRASLLARHSRSPCDARTASSVITDHSRIRPLESGTTFTQAYSLPGLGEPGDNMALRGVQHRDQAAQVGPAPARPGRRGSASMLITEQQHGGACAHEPRW